MVGGLLGLIGAPVGARLGSGWKIKGKVVYAAP
jgi:hypothetical protein